MRRTVLRLIANGSLSAVSAVAMTPKLGGRSLVTMPLRATRAAHSPQPRIPSAAADTQIVWQGQPLPRGSLLDISV